MRPVQAELFQHRAVLDRVIRELPPKIEQAALVLVETVRAGGKVLLFGNGGSAADAQHLAGELIGRYLARDRKALPAIALTADSATLTAIANDFSFASVFERQVEALAKPGDAAVGLSTSGESDNVLRGLAAARRLGCRTIGLLGRSGGRILPACDVALVVPAEETPRIQEMHILIGHILCASVDAALGPG